MPILTGILISSAPKSYRAVANSVANIFYNLFGYLPAPFLYGLLVQLDDAPQSRAGMMLLMFWTILGNLFLGLGMALRAKCGKKS